MNWMQQEAWDKMLELLTEAQCFPITSVNKTNKLLEALVYGIGIQICKEEKMIKGKPGATPKNPQTNEWKQTPQPIIDKTGFKMVDSAQAVEKNTSRNQ
jgi:hypothetical protein